MLKKLLSFSTLVLALVVFVRAANAQSTVLKNAFLTLSSPITAATSVTHRFQFYHSPSTLAGVRFQYCTEPSPAGTCSNTNGGLSGAALNDVEKTNTDDVNNWFAEAWDGASYYQDIGRTSSDGSGNATWEFEFTGATNPNIAGCNASSNSSTATCYVRITTYSNTVGGTTSASATISLTVTQSVTVSATVDPSFSLIISGVRPSQTAAANGTTLTSAVTSTVTTIPFANLTPGTEKFAAQSATVTTNAFGGYSISASMVGNMTGLAYGDEIDPFIGTGGTADNDTTAAWGLPTGTASGTNTGWLGIGSDDTAITGHNANQFYSLGTTPVTVASQTSSAQDELDIFVIGIEVNSYQRADTYQGTLRYNALPVY